MDKTTKTENQNNTEGNKKMNIRYQCLFCGWAYGPHTERIIETQFCENCRKEYNKNLDYLLINKNENNKNENNKNENNKNENNKNENNKNECCSKNKESVEE